MNILPSDNSYKTFCDLTSGYRMFFVMGEAIRSGIIDLLEEGELSSDKLLAETSLQREEGGRFLSLLLNVGLLEQCGEQLYLSRFSRSYLSRNSPTSQRHVLEFEPILMGNWAQLGSVLEQGQGTLIREQSPDVYGKRLQLYQNAMSEAAVIRSRELWDAVNLLPEQGTIIDIGAGNGVYLREFLSRHPDWHGIACDMPDVCLQAQPDSIQKNITFYPCNILENQEFESFVTRYRAKADLLLFSNVCHCYSPDENIPLLQKAGDLLVEDGQMVIHDFFRDTNSFSALYDLHMLVNTWNGRSYTITETTAMLQSAGLKYTTEMKLPSRSTAIIATLNRHHFPFC